jgi:hypothetical protein
MRPLTKSLSLLLLVMLAASSLIVVEATFAQTIPKPSVPEFTLNFDKHSSDKPATYDIDPYTGQQRMLEPPKHYEWQTINVTIKNQPFTPYQINDGNAVQNIELYYSIRTKGHFDQQWTTGPGLYPQYYPLNLGPATEITLFAGSNGPNGDILPSNMVLNAEEGGKVDFQVQALIGYVTPKTSVSLSFGVQNYEVFDGTESDWSNTQTITIEESSLPAATSNPTSQPYATATSTTAATAAVSIDNLIWLPATTFGLIIAALLGIILAMALLLLYMRQKGRTKHA